MYENIIVWTGLALLFILCLPMAGLQRLLLALYGIVLRLGMLTLVGAAAYLWFRPAQLPVEVANAVRDTPFLKSILPDPGTTVFAICAVALIALVMLPLLAVIDICRRAGTRREQIVVSQPVRVQTVPVVYDGQSPPAPRPQNPPPSRFGRRAAANAMAQAGSTR